MPTRNEPLSIPRMYTAATTRASGPAVCHWRNCTVVFAWFSQAKMPITASNATSSRKYRNRMGVTSREGDGFPVGNSGAGSRLQHHFNALVLLIAEDPVRLRRLFQRQAVRNDEARVELALLDPRQQRLQVAVDVRLAHLEGQPLAEGGAKVDLVQEAAVDAGDRHRAALAAGLDRLAQRVGPVAFH